MIESAAGGGKSGLSEVEQRPPNACGKQRIGQPLRSPIRLRPLRLECALPERLPQELAAPCRPPVRASGGRLMERTDTLTAAQRIARVQMKQTPTWLYARAAVPRRTVVGVLGACSPTT